jgi:hypothetical protein
MLGFAVMPTMDLWYLHMPSDQVLEIASRLEDEFGLKAPKMTPHRLERIFAKARARDNLAALAKLTETDGKTIRLASRPPLLAPVRELWAADDAERVAEGIGLALASYRASLRDDRPRCLSSSRWSTWQGRWSGWAVSAPTAMSPCCRASVPMTCCSSRSSRQKPPSWNRTCNRAATATTASGS